VAKRMSFKGLIYSNASRFELSCYELAESCPGRKRPRTLPQLHLRNASLRCFTAGSEQETASAEPVLSFVAVRVVKPFVNW